MKIKFLGEASGKQVTGSNIMVTTSDKKILLDCGMAQTNNLYKDYKINSADFPFKVKDIDLIIASHLHCDHIGLIPKLYNRGFNGHLHMTKGSKPLLKYMLDDSEYIVSKTMTYIQSQNKKTKICYEKKDVERCIGLLREHMYDERVYIDDKTYFMMVSAGHIAHSAQIVINHKGKSIGYTGDLGKNPCESFYTTPFIPLRHVDVLMCESTYGERNRGTTNRDADLALLERIIKETQGSILIPSFALARTQEMVTHLYDINPNRKVYIDSPLSSKITYEYSRQWDMEEIFDWQNFKIVDKWKDSQAIMMSSEKKIILSSQGMLQAGRSMEYAKHMLENPLNTIVFVGYNAEGTIGRQIQDGAKIVKIMGEEYNVNCRVETLHSFSSHMQREQLLDYYSTINANKIILTHGSAKAKLELKEDLEKILYDKCKTTKVLISEKGMEVEI